jgi:iron(III) transport system ATP-binding protein
MDGGAMSFLQLRDLRKQYGQVVALDGLSLDIPAKRRTVIVGPSGSGKTTLLRLIAGFEPPDAGSITLDGTVLADAQNFIPAHLRNIGLVAQDGALFPHLSVGDNIGFGIGRVPDREERILALMDMVELDRVYLVRRPHELSGGQQQRVALARALARRPRLMLLDEPFSALDTSLREATRKSVARVLEQAGITTVLVTHDQAEALSFGDQVAMLEAGRVRQAGLPTELYTRPADRTTAAFLGDSIVLPATLGAGYVDCVLGRIAADTDGRQGNVAVMLRPEQLKLSASPSDGPSAHAEVTAVEFCGPHCMMTVQLNGSKVPLSFRVPTLDAQPVGTEVRIDVVGKAHVFSGDEF